MSKSILTQAAWYRRHAPWINFMGQINDRPRKTLQTPTRYLDVIDNLERGKGTNLSTGNERRFLQKTKVINRRIERARIKRELLAGVYDN